MANRTGQVAVITGAASGIGKALAMRCARDGMRVVLADVEREALEGARRETAAFGADTLAIVTDVSRADDVAALADRAWERFGAVDVLCNNAGVFVGGRLWERTLQDFQWVLGVNLWGLIHGIHHFVPRMLAQDREAHVVNTSSMAGLMSGPLLGVYNITKHGIVTISETLFHELQMDDAKLEVHLLCPGMTATKAGDTERNRPAPLHNDASHRRRDTDLAMDEAIRSGLSSGQSAELVADAVLDAIDEHRFYVFPDAGPLAGARSRMNDLLAMRNPTLAPGV